MRYLFLALILFLAALCHGLKAQNITNDTANYPYWVDMMQRPGVNFAATQRAFNMYWKDRKITKGCGWKPFKRWEYYWQYRLDSNGNIPAASDVWNSFYGIKGETNTNPFEQKGESDIQYKGNEGNWKPLGPILLPNNISGQPNGLGRVNAVAFHPTDSNIIYAGAPAGGFWITKNHGQTWRTTTDSLPSLGVSSIAVNPSNPNTIYIGTGDRDGGDSYGYGVLKTNDGGETWFVANTGMGSRTVGKLLINPSSPNTLIAATNNGMYKTTNGGNTWAKTSITADFKDVTFKPGDYTTVYATEAGNFYRSTDGGNSWTKITSGIPTGHRGVIGVSANAPDYVYFLLTENSVFKGIYRSTNSGVNFSTRSTTPNIMGYAADGSGTTGQGWYDLCIAVEPTNKDIVYAGGVNVFKSTDGGTNWTINAHWTGSGGGDDVHADQHVFEYSPVNGRLFVGNDGGLYYNRNGAKDWRDISSGMAIAQIYRHGQSAQSRKKYIHGYQDNGTAYFDGEWHTIRGGDGMDCVVDYSDEDIMIGSLYYGDFVRYKAGRSEGTFAAKDKLGITEEGGWVTPMIQHNTDPAAFFAGYKNVWRTTNGKGDVANITWTKISDNLAGSNNENITALEQHSTNPDILYMSRGDNKFFRCDNPNATTPTWTNLTSKLPVGGATPRCIETGKYSNNRVYIGLGKAIYRSDNKGDTWADVTGNIPNLTINTIVVDTSKNQEEVYAGTDAGVYYRNFTTMANWVYFFKGLPLSTNVTELEIYYNIPNPTNSKLRASTYGRGMWETDLYTDGTKKPVVDFNADRREMCVNSIITLDDNTGYIPTKLKWQFSPSNVTYLNGTTDTSETINVRLNASGNISVTLIAQNANGSDTAIRSNYIYVYDTAKRTCVTTTTGATGFGIGVHNVKLANVDNSSNGFDQNGSYEDYTCQQIIQLRRDSTYTLYVTTGSYNDESVKAFIDYNNDGDFKDFGEQIFAGPSQRTNHSTTFTTPKTAIANKLLRMRVISDYGTIGSPDCPTLGYGQSEDYNVYFDAPTASLTVANDTLCFGDTVVYTASSSGKINTLVWDFGAGASPQTASGNGTFKVVYGSTGFKKVTAAINGNTAYQKDSLVWIAVKPTANFIVRDTLSCSVSRAFNFTNNSGGASQLTYTWKFGDNTTATATHPYKTYATAGAYTVWLVAKTTTGCTDSVSKVVNPSNSSLNTAFTIDSASLCLKGNVFTVTNTSSPSAGTIVSYELQWGDGATTIPTGSVQHSYKTDGTYTVKLKAASTAGCSDSIMKNVQVNPQPVADFNSNPFTGCAPLQTQFNNSSSVSNGTLTYLWQLGQGDTSTKIRPEKTFAVGGLYAVKLTATTDKGCKHDTTKNLMVFDKPTATFSKTYLADKKVTFTPSISGYPTYRWNFGDNTGTQTGFSPTHQYASGGTYTVLLEVEDNQGCRNTGTDTVNILGVGISQLNNIKGVQVVPNPFSNSIDVSFTLAAKQVVKVYMVDVLGRKVLDTYFDKTPINTFAANANTEQLPQGFYQVVIEAGTEKYAVKVVK
jgi:PKD repeat protein/photosystem II stability/assembly factor-like uncharacterized protein